ncbi:MAG: DUF72 domain-containing protein [Candidatus Aminicenantes bacterium]|nr:DUF72 domain-containing protein [Candidatus Aminicenantes bacterium]NIQ72358.1 DUF72 domain-containing protein [Candidatus Aminicenantes bacterium]NIT28396.1 DUF72 domain-containing protein [Candidatus Aminicenantes bacterium]
MWLEYYAEHFNTVELNASFYHIPKNNVTMGWAQRTPRDFKFSVKVTRLITHVRKLQNCDDIIEWFFREMEPLRKKVLVYLLQLPPSFTPNPDHLKIFLNRLPQINRYVIEFRNESAFTGSLPDILTEKNIGFCIHDYPGIESPPVVTSDVVYVRFHGYGRQYAGSYPDDVLRDWSIKMKKWSDGGRTVLVYFNNDLEGSAISNALTLRENLSLHR